MQRTGVRYADVTPFSNKITIYYHLGGCMQMQYLRRCNGGGACSLPFALSSYLAARCQNQLND